MSAMTADRITAQREPSYRRVKVKGNTRIYAGALVCLSAGLAIPAAAASGLITVGVAQESVTNTGADGTKEITVKSGCYLVRNGAGADQVTLADINSNAYVIDDQTVGKTNGGGSRPVAGRVYDVDAGGVWIII